MIMFRTLLIAVLSALALSSLTVGSAQAATPAPSILDCAQVLSTGAKCDSTTDLNAKVESNTDANVLSDSAKFAAITEAQCIAKGNDWRWDPTPAPGRCVPDRNRSGHGPVFGHPPVLGGSWNDRLDGRYFRLDRGPALDVCDSGYSSYDLFLSRNGSYRDRISRQLNAQRFADLRRADCGSVVVSNDGDCVTYATARDSIRNYGLAYNRYRSQYGGNWSRLNTHDRSDLSRLYSLNHRYVSEGWNQSRLSNLRTVCQDNSPTVTIVNEAPPATIINSAPAASAPAYSAPSPQVSTVPSGPAQTGGYRD